MDQLHPAIAHFPFALLLVSVVFDSLAYAFQRPVLHVVGFWNLLVGVIGGFGALYSGYLAERKLLGMEMPGALISSHRDAGLAAIILFGVLLCVRIVVIVRRRPFAGRALPVYILAALVAGGLLASTGRSGTRLVFEAGAGVMQPEQPRVAVLPEAGASHQAVWAFGRSANPAYGRPPLSAGIARVRAAMYLRNIRPGEPLLRIRNGCKELHVPLLHGKQTVAGIRVHPEDGRLLARSEHPCAKNVRVPPHAIAVVIKQSLSEAHVGATAWQGGHGAYWNVPLFKSGRMIDILRISSRDGSVVPISTQAPGME